MDRERKKYNKLVNHIYTKYSLRYELKYSMRAICIILAFGFATMFGYSLYLVKTQGFNLPQNILHISKICLFIFITMVALCLISLLLDVIIRKIRFTKEKQEREFENYVKEELNEMHAVGKLANYEIGRFYLFDSLSNFDLDFEELGITLDDTPKKSNNKKKPANKKQTKSNKKKQVNKDKKETVNKKQKESKPKSNATVVDHRARRLNRF